MIPRFEHPESTTGVYRLILAPETAEEEERLFQLTIEGSFRTLLPHYKDGCMVIEFVRRQK